MLAPNSPVPHWYEPLVQKLIFLLDTEPAANYAPSYKLTSNLQSLNPDVNTNPELMI